MDAKQELFEIFKKRYGSIGGTPAWMWDDLMAWHQKHSQPTVEREAVEKILWKHDRGPSVPPISISRENIPRLIDDLLALLRGEVKEETEGEAPLGTGPIPSHEVCITCGHCINCAQCAPRPKP